VHGEAFRHPVQCSSLIGLAHLLSKLILFVQRDLFVHTHTVFFNSKVRPNAQFSIY
jgi:hypothetical protein